MRKSLRKSPIGSPVNVFSLCFLLVGCGSAAEPQSAPAPPVTVSYPVEKEVTDYEDYTGRTAAVDSVTIRAQVTGYLDKINFQEGADVAKGAVLFEIDPRTYQATLASAEASLEKAQASEKLAKANLTRANELMSKRAIAQQDYDTIVSQHAVDVASVLAAKAAVKQARLNVEFTKVTAPVAGRVGRTLVTRGNLVIANQTQLTTLVSEDPIYAYFDVDEPTVLRVRQLIKGGKFKSIHEKGTRIPVSLGLANEQGFPHKGHVDFVSNQLDPFSATLSVRGVFRNPRLTDILRLMSPNMFVRVRVQIGAPYQALLVTQAALGEDQNLQFVYVVNDQNRVERHNVTLGNVHDGLQVIKTGLKPKERVIVNGLQHVNPGAIVSPKLVAMPIPTKGTLPQTPPAVLKNPAPGNGKK
ncbi:MAG TPA: efflux RND transporter periplasmic adaptor subunit [Gemmataceae bacterium]|nr:efflux RND transporter periplasmic adaptor subunit [Gemmataceae bacterium]